MIFVRFSLLNERYAILRKSIATHCKTNCEKYAKEDSGIYCIQSEIRSDSFHDASRIASDVESTKRQLHFVTSRDEVVARARAK